MDAKNQLVNEKNKLMVQIAEFAQQGKAQEVLAVGQRLEKVEFLIARYEKLLHEILDLGTEDRDSKPLEHTRVVSKLVKDEGLSRLGAVPGRGEGRGIRKAFLEKVFENGINLRHLRSTIYETPSGHKVGIAVATERKPDRWFLGLPLEGYDQAVLLCKREAGDTVAICLPMSFFRKYGEKLSQSGGQMKFNVARRGSDYAILVPGIDGVSVSKFLEDYSLLK